VLVALGQPAPTFVGGAMVKISKSIELFLNITNIPYLDEIKVFEFKPNIF
jgi:hypothetical protein